MEINKKIKINTSGERKEFLKYIDVHGINNIVTVYKHYFCDLKEQDKHIYIKETYYKKYIDKLLLDKEDANFIWEKIIVLERIIKNKLYNLYIEETIDFKKSSNVTSEDIFNLILRKCSEKNQVLSQRGKETYYNDEIINKVNNNVLKNHEFYLFIKELNWSNIITIIKLLKSKYKNKFESELDLNLNQINQLRILRNSLAHGDYIVIYLNKQIYDSENYEKLEVINKVRKIISKTKVEGGRSEEKFIEIYNRHKIGFEIRKKNI